MTADGELQTIPGGSQPTKPDFEVYGSCVYKSRITGTHYLFVNAKSSEYLQYALTWSNGALHTELVRSFFSGSGGQVEGCVADEENGWVFIGEEPSALWRYGAEPTDDPEMTKTLVAQVGDGKLFADVEGVTLVQGHTPDKGFIIVSCQGVSAYNVYKRASPHEYVGTFTITRGRGGRVDAVSNTDGIAAIGTNLGPAFPRGLIVVHDDANQLPDGTTSEEASFKLVSLGDVLGARQWAELNLLEDVDTAWDPRA
jgi:3-phytase